MGTVSIYGADSPDHQSSGQYYYSLAQTRGWIATFMRRMENKKYLNDNPVYQIAGTTGGGHKFSEEAAVLNALHCAGFIRDWAAPVCKHQQLSAQRSFESPRSKNWQSNPFVLAESLRSVCVSGQAGLPHWRTKCLNINEIGQLREILSHDRGAGKTNPLRGRRCAVVGISGNLLHEGHGPEIDRHDIVIRFGCAATQHFEADVGRRTTHRFVYPEAVGAPSMTEPCGKVLDWTEEAPVSLIRLYKSYDLPWWTAVLSGRSPPSQGYWRAVPKKFPNNAGLAVLNPSWIEEVQRWAGISLDLVMSQGVLGVLLAVASSCDTTNVYGFGMSTEGRSAVAATDSHYYE